MGLNSGFKGLIKGLRYIETTKVSHIEKENDRPERFLLSAYCHIILKPPVATLCLLSYELLSSCCYSLPIGIISSSLLLLINKIVNTVYTQLLLLSAYCHIILQAPVTNKQNNSKNTLYTTVATMYLPTLILSSSLLLLLSAYCNNILQPPVTTLCLMSCYPPASCCYSLPTAILYSRLLLLLSAYCHIVLQPAVANKQNNSK